MIKHCIFRTRKDNIHNYIIKNNGLVIIYGQTFWGGMLADIGDIKIDYFCDRKALEAAEMYTFHSIPVLSINKLESIIAQSEKRATIIICTGRNKDSAISIYKDLAHLDIDADIFNYFENDLIFNDSEFEFNGKSFALFEHSFNCGYINERMTERSVELSLALNYIQMQDNITELGAVTPYYFFEDKIFEIIDPTDAHKRATKKSLFDCDLTGKNILSISTVEHIGTSDYGMNEKKTPIDAIEKILKEASSCLITAPLGYNRILDEWVKENQSNPKVKVLKRYINNHWECVKDGNIAIDYTPLWANGLVIIEK